MLLSSSLSAVVSAVVSLSPTAEADDDGGASRFHRGGGGGGGVTHGSVGSLVVVMGEGGSVGSCFWAAAAEDCF